MSLSHLITDSIAAAKAYHKHKLNQCFHSPISGRGYTKSNAQNFNHNNKTSETSVNQTFSPHDHIDRRFSQTKKPSHFEKVFINLIAIDFT